MSPDRSARLCSRSSGVHQCKPYRPVAGQWLPVRCPLGVSTEHLDPTLIVFGPCSDRIWESFPAVMLKSHQRLVGSDARDGPYLGHRWLHR